MYLSKNSKNSKALNQCLTDFEFLYWLRDALRHKQRLGPKGIRIIRGRLDTLLINLEIEGKINGNNTRD